MTPKPHMLERFLEPKSFQDRKKGHSKSLQKSNRILIRFLIDFGLFSIDFIKNDIDFGPQVTKCLWNSKYWKTRHFKNPGSWKYWISSHFKDPGSWKYWKCSCPSMYIMHYVHIWTRTFFRVSIQKNFNIAYILEF